MRKFKVSLLAVLVLTAGTLLLLDSQASFAGGKNKKDNRVYLNEYGLRYHAVRSVTPTYPQEAIDAGAQGLVDAAVRFDREGNFDRVKILESPHPAISEAVTEALKQWKVRLLTTPDGEPVRLHGELRFNFSLNDGEPRVTTLTAQEQNVKSKAYSRIENEDVARKPDSK